MTYFPKGNIITTGRSFNTAIQELASTINNVYSVDVTGSGLRDANHWNYVGMKQVTGAMLDVFENLI